MSNFLKNLHPLLRRKKNPKDNEDVNYALIKVLNEEMNLIEQDAIESKLQSSLKSSTGTYLDNFGDWFGVYRKKDEDDEKYRARIIKYLLLKRGTNNAIIEAIKDYLEDSNADVSIYEPFRNIFYTNKSHLNGQDHLMGYYYNFAIINVSIGSYFPVEIVDVINEFKPAGVKFYVTYDGGGTNTGNSIIKVLDEPVNIDVYQNIDRLSGYSETFYGHINMGHRKVNYDSETDIFRTNRSKINSNDVLTGSSSIGRAFHNYAYKTNFIYNPTRTSTVSEIQKVLDEKGRELPLEYYINTTEKNRASVYIDIESTTGTSFIYNNLNLREYFNQYKPELLHGDTQEIKNAISSYVGVATFDLFMEALISPNDVVSTQTQVFDFSIGKWVTINSSEITYGMKNVGAELGYIKDYMNNELNMFTRVVIASSSDITVNINYLDLLFYHYTADVYTVKPYKGLIEYYIELDRLSYVDASKVPSLSNGDVISKTGYEPMGYVRIVGDSEVYYSTDIPDYVQNEIILRNTSGEVLETTKVDSEYTTTNSVYNGLRTYNHTVMLYGSYTNISEIEVRGTGELTNAKLQYTRYNNPSSWNTLEEIKKLTPTEEPFSLKYENKLRDLYGLQLIDYSELNAMSTVKLKSIWETTIGEITDTEGSFTDMSSGYFNAVWQYIDRLDTVSLNSLKVLDDVSGGIIDNSTQTVLIRRVPNISQYTEVTDYREVRPIYTESLIMNSPRRLYELADVTMVDETINIDRRIKVIDSHTEQEPNTNILIDSYKTREIVGSGFADYNLKEPIEQGETYNVKITGNFKSGLERIAVGNSSGSFNEVFIYPEDIKNGVINKTYTARLDQYAEGKQRLNKDYRLYIQPYTSDSSIIYSVELRKL